MMRAAGPSETSFTIICAALIAIKLWLLTSHQLLALPMPHDDTLFISLAESIASGNWLGSYNQLTLIKGSFYPLFIALAYFLGLPLLLAQQLLWAAGCYLFVRALRLAVANKWLLLLLFTFLLFNPFSYNYPAVGRVLRLGIYQSLCLLVFGSMLGLYLRAWPLRKTSPWWALATGFFFSALWHTREESIWILPPLAILLLALLIRYYCKGHPSPLLLVVLILTPVLIWTAATLSLRTINYTHYKLFTAIELKTSEFKSAYGGLLRIKSENWRRFHPVVKDARQKAYAVSPSFGELEPFLEGELGEKWVWMSGTNDISAAFFVWAFRDAAAYAGYYQDGPSTMEFYRRMGEELDQACRDKLLDCRPRLTSLIPAWHSEFNELVIPTYFSILKKIISFSGFSASTEGLMSRGPSKLMWRYETITRETLRTSRKDVLESYPEFHTNLDREKERILENIGDFYRAVVPYLFIASTLLAVVTISLPALRKKLSCYTVFTIALISGIGAMAFILTLVVVTSYISIDRAMHVTYPMVLMVICFGFLAVYSFRDNASDRNETD